MAAPYTVRCATQELVESLPAEAQGHLHAALASPHIATGDILAVLAQHGVAARAENVNRHRRRLRGGRYACKCPLTDKATLR